MNDSETLFECHDIYLAAYLIESGCELKGRRKQGHRIHFQFTNVGGSIQTLREDFFAGRAKIVACKYADAIRKVKELLGDL